MRLAEAREEYVRDLSGIYEQGEASAIFDLAAEAITGMNRQEFRLKKEKILTEQQQQDLQKIISRLRSHEPIQYIINEAWFCGLKFYVDRNVLIPRPETEELVEWIISDCRFPVEELRILDVGTGSGCIGISLKRRIRKASVSAIDNSENALAVAKKNSEKLGTPLDLVTMDFLDKEAKASLGKFDIVVSNPPYIPRADASTLDRHVVEHEPGTALFVPGDDAVIFYRELAEFGSSHLTEGGMIYAEMHPEHSQKVKEVFEAAQFIVDLKSDMQGKIRMIRARQKN